MREGVLRALQVDSGQFRHAARAHWGDIDVAHDAISKAVEMLGARDDTQHGFSEVPIAKPMRPIVVRLA